MQKHEKEPSGSHHFSRIFQPTVLTYYHTIIGELLQRGGAFDYGNNGCSNG